MSFTTEQKSQLAKLMATENITVQHQKIQTAMFDTKNRVLYLPIWQDMSGSLYDLLTGHEVGHALYTPAEGWHDVAADKSRGKNFKNFLNVVEDTRIEKKIQRRYPGLRPSFIKAYSELMQKDFFGLAQRDINTLPFIDRLNVYSKSQYTLDSVVFSDFENELLDKVKVMESWEDVLRVTQEIYDYSKSEQSQLREMNHYVDMSSTGDGDGEEVEFEYEEDSDSQQDGEKQESDSKGKPKKDDSEDVSESENEGSDNQSEDESEESEDDAEDGDTINHDKDSSASESDQSPRCETDEHYREQEDTLLDPTSKTYVYLKVPKPDMKKIFTPHKRVQELLTEFFNSDRAHSGFQAWGGFKPDEWVNDFKRKNERYVNLLVKEFEMRKAAKAYNKSRIANTGDLDINKLSSYRFDENIFRKTMIIPKGKSHGLMLLLDKSGSMMNSLSGSIEQVLVLTMFCRKVNIPFVVYGFGDAMESTMIDRNLMSHEYYKQGYEERFSQNPNEMRMTMVNIREYLSSEMTTSEFHKALCNMVLLKKSYELRQYPKPYSEELSNTPLTQAVVACADLMTNFKKKNNLDFTSLVIVHDGDADRISSYHKMNKQGEKVVGYIEPSSQNVILMDDKIGYQRKVDDVKGELIGAVTDWFRKKTESRVFGFFLCGSGNRGIKSSIRYHYTLENGDKLYTLQKDYSKYEKILSEKASKLRDEKFLESSNVGFDNFFFILGGSDLNTTDDELDVEVNATPARIKSAFMKKNRDRATNRVLVNRFIHGIVS
jgi:hypothetical protein